MCPLVRREKRHLVIDNGGPTKWRRRRHSQLIFCCLLMYPYLGASLIHAQISPNPNPPGNTITVTAVDYNTVVFVNNHQIVISGTGTLYNNAPLTNNGIVSISGELWNSNVLENNGSLTNYYSLYNFGALENNATLDNDGLFDNFGVLTNNGDLLNSIDLTNYNTLENTSVLVNNDTLSNHGDLVNTGTLSFQSGSTFTQESGATYTGNGTLLVYGGATVNGTIINASADGTLGFNNMGSIDGTLLTTTYVNFLNLTITGGSTTLTGAWDFANGSSVVDAGNLSIDGSLLTTDITLASIGSVDINGAATVSGTTDLSGTFNVSSGGSFSSEYLVVQSSGIANIDGSSTLGASSTVDGTINIGNTGSLLNTGYLTNSGSMDNFGILNNTGTMDLQSGSTFTQEVGATYTGNGTLLVQSGATVNGTIANASGDGTLGFSDMGTVDGSHFANFANLDFYGANTLTGAWDFSSGSVSVYSGNLAVDGSLLAASMGVASGGTVDINGAATVSGTTNVSGTLNVQSGGSYSSEYLIAQANSAVNINGSATLGASSTVYGAINIGTTGSLLNTGYLTNYGSVDNSGILTNTGTLELQSGSTFTQESGATYTGNGTLLVHGGATINGAIVNASGDGSLCLHDMEIVDGSHFANFGKLDLYGTNILTGTWDFSGGSTTVHDGSLSINGSLSSASLSILPGATANIYGLASIGGHSEVDGNLFIFSGASFTGASLAVASSGYADIDGSAVIQGATDIYGRLSLNGTLQTSQLTIERDGLLFGNGSVSGNLVSYGTISPGHSIGTLSVNGSLTLKSDNTYIAELAEDGASDLIRVSGSAVISGGTVDAYLPMALYPDGRSWTIISASGGINGTFSSLEKHFTSYTIDLAQEIQGNNLCLVIVRTPYGEFVETNNQKELAAALNTLLVDAHDDMESLLFAMDFAMTPLQLNSTIVGLNPEMYTSFAPAGLGVAKLFVQMPPLTHLENKIQTTSGNPWNVWTQGIGAWSTQDSQDGISGYDVDTTGILFGMDRSFLYSPIRAGMVLGTSSSDLSWDNSAGSGSISGRHIGLYGNAKISGVDFGGSLGYTSLDNSASRHIDTPIFATSTSATFSSTVYNASLSGYLDVQFGRIHLGPVVGLDYLHLDQEGFTESGGDFAVHMGRSSSDSLTPSLGLRASGKFAIGDWRLCPKMMIGLSRQFLEGSTRLSTHFRNYPDATFSVSSAKPARYEGVIITSLIADYRNNLSFYLDALVSVANNQNSRTLSAGLQWSF